MDRLAGGAARPPSRDATALFVRHRLQLRSGGLTKAWLRRVRLYESAGWSVRVALISPDPEIDETLGVLRREGQLPEAVTVHHFGRDRLSVAHRLVARAVPAWRGSTIPAWLDRVASADSSVVFADSPVAYPLLASMRNPHVARVYVVHLAHLSARATQLGDPRAIANGPMTQRFSRVTDETMRAADRVVVLTEAQAEDFRLRWGPDLPVAVIPHCAEPVVVPDIAYDPDLVLVIGRLDYYKRWDHAIRIMARVVQEVPGARLRIHGRGDDLERLQRITQELGLSDAVTFAGFTASPLEAMAGAACLIHTTRREAMPLTLLESLSVGTPVITYDVRYGPREVVRDGVDGFVVPVRDVRAASAAVVRLLAEPGLRGRMSDSAREVTQRFSRADHDRAWLALGRELAQHSRARPGSALA